jgi:hypothetical protein
MSYPQPHHLGVKRRGSSGVHQRDLNRATVGRRQSYGMPRNLPGTRDSSHLPSPASNDKASSRACRSPSTNARGLWR